MTGRKQNTVRLNEADIRLVDEIADAAEDASLTCERPTDASVVRRALRVYHRQVVLRPRLVRYRAEAEDGDR